MAFVPWQGAASRCSGKAQAGAKNLLIAGLEVFPRASNLGIYNCRYVAGVSIRSIHADGRAIDFGFPLKHADGFAFVQKLLGNTGKLGLQQIIWCRKSWSARYPYGTYYGGVNPHYDHVHVEMGWASAVGLNLASARYALNLGVYKPPALVIPSAERLVAAHDAGLRGQWVYTYEVTLLQQRFRALGHGITVDGKYGWATRNSVSWEQKMAALPVTGIADYATVMRLFPA